MHLIYCVDGLLRTPISLTDRCKEQSLMCKQWHAAGMLGLCRFVQKSSLGQAFSVRLGAALSAAAGPPQLRRRKPASCSAAASAESSAAKGAGLSCVLCAPSMPRSAAHAGACRAASALRQAALQ